MILREAPLCARAVRKLRSDGWTVACEVQSNYRFVDAAGTRDGKLMMLEAKISLNGSLIRQLYQSTLVGDFVLGVIGKKPRDIVIDWCVKEKIGIWLVIGEEITELVRFEQLNPHRFYREDVIKRLEVWDQALPGGVPNMKGVGVAQDVQRRVDEYRSMNPRATWRDIFTNVPSHYDSYKNMYSALRSNAERLAWRQRSRAQPTK